MRVSHSIGTLEAPLRSPLACLEQAKSGSPNSAETDDFPWRIIMAPTTPLTDQIVALAHTWSQSQRHLIETAVDMSESEEWLLARSPTAAHHLAALVDIEPCTAREWLRVGRRVRELPLVQHHFTTGELSYSKVRALVSVATADNEAELVELALGTPAGDLRAAIARHLTQTLEPDELAAHQHRRRSVSWRAEADGMVTFTLRLPPHVAAVLIALLTTMVMRTRPRRDASAAWPTANQQYADAFHEIINSGTGSITTEVVLHVRGDGCSADDGTPIPDTIIAELVPNAFVRALIHDAERRPINASARRRHPTSRQKRVVKERDRACVDCGRSDLLNYDHTPPYELTKHTIIEELELRCAPCHHARHAG